MNIVIYSKDRACQLDALLRSLKKNFKEYSDSNVSVIYATSHVSHDLAYDELFRFHPEVRSVWEDPREESSFKLCTLNALDSKQAFTMFLVDDILFKHPFSETDDQLVRLIMDKKVLCTSLRLDKNISHCYATNSSQKVPQEETWNWRLAEGDWGYPMSLDGNVYKTSVISKIVRSLKFDHPNVMEGVMASYASVEQFLPPKMTCYYEASRLLNVPANRVQEVAKNRVEDSYTAQELKLKFLNREIIDISGLDKVQNTSCHWPLTLSFVKDTRNANLI